MIGCQGHVNLLKHYSSRQTNFLLDFFFHADKFFINHNHKFPIFLLQYQRMKRCFQNHEEKCFLVMHMIIFTSDITYRRHCLVKPDASTYD